MIEELENVNQELLKIYDYLGQIIKSLISIDERLKKGGL